MDVREKAGKILMDLKAKKQDKVNVFEFVQTTQQDYMPQLVALVEQDKKKSDKDFYVEVCLRRNTFMADVIERYMISRHTCPTPFYDRSVFHYSRRDEKLEFLWHVPSLEECDYYVNNILTLRDDEKEAGKMVIEFLDGTLLRRAKFLNNETEDHELTFFHKN